MAEVAFDGVVMRGPNSEDLRQLYRNDFRSFIHLAFCEAYPDQRFVDAWYLDVIADALMACSPGSGARLMLNVAPRSLKSFCASVCWPLFLLAHAGDLEITVVAGTQDLANALSELRDRLLRSNRIRAIFPELRVIHERGGLHFATGGRLTQGVVSRSQIGRGSHVVIIDDPLAPMHADDPVRRSAINAWYGTEVAPRLNDKGAVVVVVMQRLHMDDLCGHLLRGPEPWRRVALPAVARVDEIWTLSDGRVHHRRKGEALCPAAADLQTLRARLHVVGAKIFAAQYLQHPLDLPPNATHRVACQFEMFVALPGHEHRTPPPKGMFSIPLVADILANHFGERPPLDHTGFRKMTSEELEKMAVEQQARMVAEMREDALRRRP